jgi:putative tryptophan/tyrosine transport system substrate-binding protein
LIPKSFRIEFLARRREFITLLGGAAVWPLAARAQQPQPMRRIAMLQTVAADDREAQRRNVAFVEGLQKLGWSEGRNLHIDMRWAGGDAERIRRYAVDLAALAPDATLAVGSASVTPMQQTTSAIPIVFVNVPDPVGAGFVDSLSRPGGNTTGFTNFEYGISGKCLELLKEIRLGLTRAAIVRDPAITAGIGQWGAIQSVAPSLGVELSPVNMRDTAEIEHAVATFARRSSAAPRPFITAGAPGLVKRCT